MTPDRAVKQLHKLADLLDRARDDARAEGLDLEALLTEATQSLLAVQPAIASADAAARAALTIAARRARSSQLALEQTLREELARVGRQLDLTAPGPRAGTRLVSAAVPAHRLDRVG